MVDSNTVVQESLLTRLRQATPWFLAAGLAFYLIGILGSKYLDEKKSWPIHKAQVIDTNIKWASGMADEYSLSVRLKVHPKDHKTYEASLYQVGPQGALEKRTQNVFAKDAWIEIRSQPGHIGNIVLNTESAYLGTYIWAIIISLLIISNGFIILNKGIKNGSD